MKIHKRSSSCAALLSVGFIGVLFSGCRSTPETNLQTYRVICDERLAVVIDPLLPEVEKRFGKVQVDFYATEQIPDAVLDAPADVLLALEEPLGVGYLLKLYTGLSEDMIPEYFEGYIPMPQPGTQVLAYEVFRLQYGTSRVDELMQLLCEQGLGCYSWKSTAKFNWDAVMNLEIPAFNAQRLSFKKSVQELWRLAEEVDSEIDVPDYRFDLPGEGPPLTLKLRNISFLDAVRILTEICDLEYQLEENIIVFIKDGRTGPRGKFYRVEEEKILSFLDKFKASMAEAGGKDLNAEPLKNLSINDQLNAAIPAFFRGNFLDFPHVEYERDTGSMYVSMYFDLYQNNFEKLLRLIHVQPDSMVLRDF